MIYRVFDTSINKLFGTFKTEKEAMVLVRTLVGTNEDNWADDLAVGYERADGSFKEPLTGPALLERAEQVVAQRASGSSTGSGDPDVYSMAASAPKRDAI
ncbi:MAG: hypothetical protein M3R06_00355 [Chloroflexota bacterium]|nr:hypothetical protein [Chloroflexota bacterium]